MNYTATEIYGELDQANATLTAVTSQRDKAKAAFDFWTAQKAAKEAANEPVPASIAQCVADTEAEYIRIRGDVEEWTRDRDALQQAITDAGLVRPTDNSNNGQSNGGN